VGEDLVSLAVNAGFVLANIAKKMPNSPEAQEQPERHP
jgi:hypothetical protein